MEDLNTLNPTLQAEIRLRWFIQGSTDPDWSQAEQMATRDSKHSVLPKHPELILKNSWAISWKRVTNTEDIQKWTLEVMLYGWTLKAWSHWKKPDTTGHILNDSISVKSPKEVNPWRQKAEQWRPGTGVTGMRNDCLWGGGMISCVDENVLKLVLVLVAQVCEYAKNQWIVYFKWENCVIYYLNKVVYKKKESCFKFLSLKY